MSSSIDEPGIDWPDNRLLPAFQTPQHLEVYDMHGASYEVKLSVATLVGIINRPLPRVYLIDRDHDEFWLDKCFAVIPQEKFSLKNDAILKKLVSAYRQNIQGLIIYDPTIIDSANVATMLAGQRNGIAVSPDLAQELQQAPFELPVLTDLRAYKWSNRLQVYRWAQQNLLSSSSQRVVAGLNSTIPIAIRPFLVATRAFIYWLDPLNFWPNPGVDWLSERCLMKRILHSFAPGTAHLGWFVQEGSGVDIASKAAIPVLASDLFSNLEVWTSVQPATPLPKQTSVEIPTPTAESKVYVSFTMSEGDNLQYIQEFLPKLWSDPARGSIPIGWTISPTLIQTAPAMAEYYARTATANDELVAGPSGLGYMYPTSWPAEHLPAFLQLTGQLMQTMNLALLEVLDTNFGQDLVLMYRAIFLGSGMALINAKVQERFVSGLVPFGIRGVLSGGGQDNVSWKTVSGVLIYQNVGIAKSVSEAVSMIKQATKPQRPYFINLYVLAWQVTPTLLKQVMLELGSGYEVVTPGTLLAMLAES